MMMMMIKKICKTITLTSPPTLEFPFSKLINQSKLETDLVALVILLLVGVEFEFVSASFKPCVSNH